MNTQMTYLAYHTAGLLEAGRSFIDHNWDLLPGYRKFARDFYGLDDGFEKIQPPVDVAHGIDTLAFGNGRRPPFRAIRTKDLFERCYHGLGWRI